MAWVPAEANSRLVPMANYAVPRAAQEIIVAFMKFMKRNMIFSINQSMSSGRSAFRSAKPTRTTQISKKQKLQTHFEKVKRGTT